MSSSPMEQPAGSPPPGEMTQALVRAMRFEAADVLSLELEHANGAPWPNAGPGAHLDLEIQGVGLRQYSVLPSNDPQIARIGVQRDASSRGGSRWVHEQLRPGQTVRVSAPRNHFALDPGSAPACLIAGGIGVTPLLAMATALQQGTREWRLHYGVRSRDRIAFKPLLQTLGERVHLHVDSESGGPLSLAPLIAAAAPGTHFYCCGPAPMLQAFTQATAHLDPACVHLEHFAAPAITSNRPQGSFEIELSRSGRCIQVAPEASILDVLLDEGIAIAHSCRSGVCGSCETQVLNGEPEHLDVVLSPQERASGKTMMVCVSRAKTQRLVLDL